MSLLAELRASGAQVSLDGGEVVLRGVPRSLVARARESKAELLAELRAVPTAPPPTTEAAWAMEKRRLCVTILPVLHAASFERGDLADRAAHLTQSWLDALRHHPRHGRNWLGKHGEDLRALLQLFWPEALPKDPDLEGPALLDALTALFPGGRFGSEMDRYYAAPMPTGADDPTRAPAHEKEPGGGRS